MEGRNKNAATLFTYRWLSVSDSKACAVVDATLLNQVTWAEEEFIWRLQRKAYHHLGAFSEGKLIGYAGIRLITKRRQSVGVLFYNMAVATPFQGQGVGRELMNQMMVKASEIGPGLPMSLEVVASNVSAIALYESFGFKTKKQKEYHEPLYKTMPLPFSGSATICEMVR